MPFNGTLVGGPTFAAAAAGFAQCLVLDGATQWVDLPAASGPLDFASGSDWTVEVRVLSATSGSTRVALGYLHNLWLGMDGTGNATAHFSGGPSNSPEIVITSAVPIADGAWHSLALVYVHGSPGTGSLYVDGALAGSASGTFTLTPDATVGNCAIGGFAGIGGFAWPGDIDEVRVSNAARYSGAYTPASAPFSPTDANTVALYPCDAADQSGTTLLDRTPATSIAPNDPALLYSPYNWLVSSGAATTINAGAYLRTIFSGGSCTLGLAAGVATPHSQILARIDGGSWQQITLAAGAQSVALSMPTDTTSTSHLLDVAVKSTTETQFRWGPQDTAVTLTGLGLDAGATVRAPAARGRRILVYGDSITEGVLINGGAQPNDTDHNNATVDYSYQLGALLDAEVGVVGFGATGWVAAGNGAVPALPSSYNLLWSGQARTFSPLPDLVIYLEGANDGGASAATVQANAQTVIAALLALGARKHLVLRPLNGTQAAAIQAAVSAIANAGVVYADTTGWIVAATDTADLLHPYAFAHLGLIAPRVASAAAPLLGASGGVRVVDLQAGLSG